MGQKFEFLTISSLYVPYISATAKNRGLHAAYTCFLTLPVETLWNQSPVEKLFGMRMAGLCQFYWRTCVLFRSACFCELVSKTFIHSALKWVRLMHTVSDWRNAFLTVVWILSVQCWNAVPAIAQCLFAGFVFVLLCWFVCLWAWLLDLVGEFLLGFSLATRNNRLGVGGVKFFFAHCNMWNVLLGYSDSCLQHNDWKLMMSLISVLCTNFTLHSKTLFTGF